MLRSITVLLVACFIASACVTPQSQRPKIESVASEIEARKQRELVVQDVAETYARLFNVGYPILVKAVSFCDETSYQLGMDVWSAEAMTDEWKAAYETVYGLSGLLEIGFIAPGATAEKAGLKVGDILISVDDWDVPVGKSVIAKFWKKMNKLSASSDMRRIKIQRGEDVMTFNVEPELACDYAIDVENSKDLNAFADGERIVLNKGMMDFFKTDEELALVFSHELAHNTMKHIDAQETNMALGAAGGVIFDILGAFVGVNTQGTFTKIGAQSGGGAFSPEFEAEADYVGLYILAVSGHPIEKAAHFWRRMSLRNVGGISLTTTHPANAERFVGIENTVREIKAKIAAGEPLKPEMKN